MCAGLRRTGGLSGVLKSYREAMALEVKQAIRYNSDNNQFRVNYCE